MMNGKKSYLISFTALFSKKGYELSIGLEQIISVNNNYHLTAPVNSTYKTLIEDTMRNANKVPHSATGLFGNLTNSYNVTEYEGFEIETAVASIVSYLSDIHRYFNGETVYEADTERRLSVNKVEKVVDAENEKTHESELADKGTYLEDIVSGELYDVTILIEEGNRVTMSLKTADVTKISSSENKDDAEVSKLESFELRLNAEEGRAVLSSILRQLFDGEITLSSQATHNPDITQSYTVPLSDASMLGRVDANLITLDYAELTKDVAQEDFAEADVTKDVDIADMVEGENQVRAEVVKHSGALRIEVIEQALSVGLSEAKRDITVDFISEQFTEGEHTLHNFSMARFVEGTHTEGQGVVSDDIEAENSTAAVIVGEEVAELTLDASNQAFTTTDRIDRDGTTQSAYLADMVKREDGERSFELIESELSLKGQSGYADTLEEATTLYQNDVFVGGLESADMISNATQDTLTGSESLFHAVVQEIQESISLFDGVMAGTEKADLIQPIREGRIEGMAYRGGNTRNAVIEETVSYYSSQSAEIERTHIAGTEISAPVYVSSMEDATAQDRDAVALEVSTSILTIKDGTVHSTASADGYAHAVTDTTLQYDTVQNGVLESIGQADSVSNDVVTSHTEEAQTEDKDGLDLRLESASGFNQAGVPSQVEWGKVEMDYEGQTIGKETASVDTKDASPSANEIASIHIKDAHYHVDEEADMTNKGTLVLSTQEVETYQDGVSSHLELSSHVYDSDGVEQYVGAIQPLGGNESELHELESAGQFLRHKGTIEHDTAAAILSSSDADNRLITSAEVYVGGNPLVDYLSVAENIADSAGDSTGELAGAEVRVGGDAVVDKGITVEQLKDVVATSPEIMKTVRLMEIMYGSKAQGLIEAGMDNILKESLKEGFTLADTAAITESVIEKMKLAGAGVTVTASNQEQVTAEQHKSGDAVVQEVSAVDMKVAMDGENIEFTKAQTNVDITGSNQEFTNAEQNIDNRLGEVQEFVNSSTYDFNRPVDITELSKAVFEANKKIGVIQEREDATLSETYGGIGNVVEFTEADVVDGNGLAETESLVPVDIKDGDGLGVVHELHTGRMDKEVDTTVPQSTVMAIRDKEVDGTVSGTEFGQTYSNGLGKLHEITSAEVSGGSGETVVHEIERAETGNHYDGVLQTTEQAEQSTAGKEAITQELEWAETGYNGKDAVTPEIEGAWLSNKGHEAVLNETEQARHSDRGYEAVESKIEGGSYSESFETDLARIEGATFSKSEDAVVNTTEGATHSDGTTTSVIHEGTSAYIDDRNKTSVIAEYEQAESGTRLDTVTAEQEKAESSKSSDAVIHEGTGAGSISGDDYSIVEDLEAATRKKTQLETDIEDGTRVNKKKNPIVTDIIEPEGATRKRTVVVNTEEPERGRRPMKLVVTSIEQPEGAERPKQSIETTIEQPEGAKRPKREIETEIIKGEHFTLKPKTPAKKGRMWLIIGKIASWSIWNWKKTR
jgi:hypothetical protein